MKLPIEAYIIAASVISGSFGFFVAVFFLAVKQHRIERDTWNQARIFYTRKESEQ